MGGKSGDCIKGLPIHIEINMNSLQKSTWYRMPNIFVITFTATGSLYVVFHLVMNTVQKPVVFHGVDFGFILVCFVGFLLK